MISEKKFLALIVLILLVILPFQAKASQMSKEFSKIIEDFSVWKTHTERSIAFFKSSHKIPQREIPALRFMYIPVRSNVNSLIDRMILDLISENNNIDSERYRDSLINAQRSVDDLTNYMKNSLLPYTQEKEDQKHVKPTTGPIVFFTVAVGVASLVGATLAVLDYLEKQYKKSERKMIIKSLKEVKLSAFDDIRALNEKEKK